MEHISYKDLADALIDKEFGTAIARHRKWRADVTECLKQGKRDAYIFGTGQIGRYFYRIMKKNGAIFSGFVDNDKHKWGTAIEDELLCISPAELTELSHPLVMVGVGMYSKEVFDQLEGMGFRDMIDCSEFLLPSFFEDIEKTPVPELREKIAKVFDFLSDEESKQVFRLRLQAFLEFQGAGRPQYFHEVCRDRQYFQEDLVSFDADDVLVDCGAYTGDSLKEFLKLNKPFKKYIAYELSKKNFDSLERYMQSIRGRMHNEFIAYQAGVGSKNETIFFEENDTATGIASSGVEGKLVRMADHLVGEQVTFIKMDIEGAELDALHGAKELIQRWKPKLAICVYHRLSDLWEIPLYIKSLVPDYSIYIRQHTPLYFETVCYAIPKP